MNANYISSSIFKTLFINYYLYLRCYFSVENLYLCSLVSPEQMERTLHTNLIAPLFITKALINILAKPG